ncbi:DUF1854 domain-containing protein [Paenibacillus solisilvae]|uniref:DUF1854 domain-containing protein n=1 Tax=Paenibacillus solisilvae TaxID=2486751 RepID=A0ABW0W467_9BACL
MSHSVNMTLTAPRLIRSADGTLQARMDGYLYEQVKLVRAFPFSIPDNFISLRTADNQEILLLRDLIGLDDNSRQLANEELQRRHIIPQIMRIISIFNQSSQWFWNVDTDCGPVVIIMDNLHENIHPIADGRWILTDAEGFRFELSNVAAMDDTSRLLWQKVN